jgi:hypothetical protein
VGGQAEALASIVRVGGGTSILANIGPRTAVVFVVFLAGVVAVLWWGARRRTGRSGTSYEFDERSRARRVPPEEDIKRLTASRRHIHRHADQVQQIPRIALTCRDQHGGGLPPCEWA